MKILVTGGLGYIGSHTCVSLIEKGMEVVILDNLSNSKITVLDSIEKITSVRPIFYQIDLLNLADIQMVFSQHEFDCVIHFAGFKAVGESVEKPLMYYENNLSGTIHLLMAMRDHSCKRIVFSSSATVYGDPASCPITEDFPLHTTNPYGTTKLMLESIITDVAKAIPGFSAVLLRYFNPVGAHKSGLIGESPNGIPNNLMPYILGVASGNYPQLRIFGDDYNTPDGTGVRDYIHVLDLASGHVAAVTQCISNEGVLAYNLGTGIGYSVMDIIKHFESSTGIRIPYQVIERRPGDIATCFADTQKAKDELGFEAKYTIDDMCIDSWNFAKLHMSN